VEEVEKKKGESPKKLKSLFCSELASAVVMFENYNSFSLSRLIKKWPRNIDFFLQSDPNFEFSIVPVCSGLFLNSKAMNQTSRPKEAHRVYWPLMEIFNIKIIAQDYIH